MFNKKQLSGKTSKEKEFEFDMFGKTQNLEDDTTQLEVGQPRLVYNFISADGTLKSGYGFKILCMPTSTQDLESESPIPIHGDKVLTIWKLKWYDYNNDDNKYYIFYFNDENRIYYENLFNTRTFTYYYPTDFTSTPYATYYRVFSQDAILVSGNGKLMVVTGSYKETSETAPQIISCCGHYGKLFAITSSARGSLIYSEDLNVLEWSDEKTKDLDFGDARGDLNKIISFNDYLYLFRDFGITKLSEYGKEDLFEISHIYQSDSYINPSTIAESGEKIYFLEGNKLKYFNGSSVKTVFLDCLKVLEGCDNRYAHGECYGGKYFLACRANFNDGKLIGCENEQYKNNLLLVLDTENNHVDFMRGVDINRLLALTNRYKSKLVACFNNEEYLGKIGEITFDGEVFGNTLNAAWESGQTDFGYSGVLKRIKYFNIKSEKNCKVTFTSEKQTKTFNVKGSDKVQKVRANVLGNMFTVKIESKTQGCYISNFVLRVSCG